MLKNICEGMERVANLNEAGLSGSHTRNKMFDMFKTMIITVDDDDERYASKQDVFDSMLRDVGSSFDELADALDQIEFDDSGKYVGGGEAAARILNAPAPAIAEFLDSLEEDACDNIDRVISESASSKKKSKKSGKQPSKSGKSQCEDLTVDDIYDKIGIGSIEE